MRMLVESLCMFIKQSDATFVDIAKDMGNSKDKVLDNKKLNKIMNRIIGLKVTNKLKVCDELVQNTNRLAFFMSLTVDEHDEYVWMMLDGSSRLGVVFLMRMRMKPMLLTLWNFTEF
ncbi:hypothetical protein ACS0TY_024123 [Phlomoides rotata]